MKNKKIVELLIPPIFLNFYKLYNNVLRHQLVKKKMAGWDRLHLACGNNVLKGWANIDLKNEGEIIGWDLTHKFPVRTESVELIFSEHFIEHISFKQAKIFFSECYRCLKKNGILRLSTPNLEKLLKEYKLGRISEWHDVGWFPDTPCKMVNEGIRKWGHQYLYDKEELKSLLHKAKFSAIKEVNWRESKNLFLRNLECRPYHGEIIYEVVK